LVAVVFFAIIIDPWSAGELTLDLKNYGFAVLDLDRSLASSSFLDKLRKPFFRRIENAKNYGEIDELLTSGKAGLVVVIPEGFQKNISGGKSATVQLIFDGTNSNSSTIAISYIAGITTRFSENVIINRWNLTTGQLESIPSVDANTRVLFNENMNDRWFIVLAEFLNAITLIAILLPAAVTVYEKQTGTMEQLIVTPLKTHEIMIAKILPMALLIMVSVYVGLFLVLQVIVGVPLRGSLLYFTLVTLVFLFTTAGLGLLVSTIADNLAETILVTLIILLPLVFLSGSWTPPEAMPEWMQFLIVLSPLKYYLEIGYGIFFRGIGFAETWSSLLILAGLGGAIFTLGVVRFRKSIS
jgi:ABC-2 type transport system permease protein